MKIKLYADEFWPFYEQSDTGVEFRLPLWAGLFAKYGIPAMVRFQRYLERKHPRGLDVRARQGKVYNISIKKTGVGE